MPCVTELVEEQFSGKNSCKMTMFCRLLVRFYDLKNKLILSSKKYLGECRTKIDSARLLTLNAAKMIDTVGAKNARIEISKHFC